MRIRKRFLLFVSTILLATASSAQGTSPDTGLVWFWFDDCPNAAVMAVKIIVEGQTVYRSSFHICRMEQTGANTEREGKRRVFHFSGGHNFQQTYRTTKRDKIEGNMWQAGADKDAIILGVTFFAGGQELLNTLHVVKPGKSTQSILDRGVIIKTYSMKSTAQL